MKKFFAAALVLVLMTPAIALLCHCCPVVKTPSSPISIQKASCHCCEIVDLKRDQGRLPGMGNLVARFEQILDSKVLSPVEGFVPSDFQNHDFGQDRAGPVRFSSETPLYLTHRTLRL